MDQRGLRTLQSPAGRQSAGVLGRVVAQWAAGGSLPGAASNVRLRVPHSEEADRARDRRSGQPEAGATLRPGEHELQLALSHRHIRAVRSAGHHWCHGLAAEHHAESHCEARLQGLRISGRWLQSEQADAPIFHLLWQPLPSENSLWALSAQQTRGATWRLQGNRAIILQQLHCAHP